jgi:hypothetical protein
MDLPCAVHDNAAFKLRVDDDPRSRGGRQAEKDRLQQEGVIPAGVKFQISLPTPIAPTHNNMVPTDRPALIPVLTTHMLGEVTAIAQALPNDRIALQWDVCQEVIAWRWSAAHRPTNPSPGLQRGCQRSKADPSHFLRRFFLIPGLCSPDGDEWR